MGLLQRLRGCPRWTRRSVVVTLTLLASSPVSAQWLQWGGESGDFRVDGEGFLAAWPEAGPKLKWKRALGEGESSILADDQTLYTMYRDDGAEVVVALEPEHGAARWEYRYDAPVPDAFYVVHGDGPHATPAIAGDRMVTVGIGGRLHCLDKRSGKVVWARDLIRDYDGRSPDSGYGASPLIRGDRVIVQVGGKGQGIVAFTLADGEIAWRGSDFGAGYATPFVIEVEGQEQLVAFMRSEVAGFDPDTGALLWSHPHPTEWGANASSPVWGEDGILFISSGYDQGSRGLKLTRKGSVTTVEELWYERKLQIHFSTVQRLGDHIYGTSGDFGPIFFVAVEARSGKIAWQKRDVVVKASPLWVDGALLMIDEKGQLVLASVTPKGMTVHAEHSLVEGRVWTPPTLVGRRLYVRDRKHAYAFDLGAADQSSAPRPGRSSGPQAADEDLDRAGTASAHGGSKGPRRSRWMLKRP